MGRVWKRHAPFYISSMLECLDNIISIPECGEQESLSGRSITDLPGIGITQAANIASEKFMTGLNLLRDARRRAILDIQTDLIGFLQGNGFVPKIFQKTWSTLYKLTGGTVEGTDIGDYRGIVLKTQVKNCLLKKLYIPYVHIYPAYTGTVVLRIEDGENAYPYTVQLVAGEPIKVRVNFTAVTDEVYILLPDYVGVYSVTPNCQCSSTHAKSDCAKVIGYYNGIETKSEGFGIWADVQCKCDYGYILCQLATDGMLGEIVMYKTGVNIMDERLKTDRLNYFTTYGREEAVGIKAEWQQEYVARFNRMLDAMGSYLPRIDKCGCIECGSYRIANV